MYRFFLVMFSGTLNTVIAIPLTTRKPPRYDWGAIVSENKLSKKE